MRNLKQEYRREERKRSGEVVCFLLAGITIVALDGLGVFVKFAVLVRTDWMKAQVIVRRVHGRISTPERERDVNTSF